MDDSVGRYYDSNTGVFLRTQFARHQRRTIHRSLTLPESHTLATEGDADAVHLFLLDALRRYALTESGDAHLLDLGCGVGATLAWLSQMTAATLSGVTVSGVQAAEARRVLAGRAHVELGSFSDKSTLQRVCRESLADAAYLIEAFVHGDDPESLFRELGNVTNPGGLLIIIDDFPSPSLARLLDRQTGDRRARRTGRIAAEFHQGWHVNTYRTPEELEALARPLGWQLVEEHDLSHRVRTNRFRDRVARAGGLLLKVLRLRGSYSDNLSGGVALQRLTRMGLNRYRMLIFRKKGSVPVE